mgnify:CR=1 FL=1
MGIYGLKSGLLIEKPLTELPAGVYSLMEITSDRLLNLSPV